MKKDNVQEVAALIEGFGDDDFDLPDSIDRAILSAGPEGNFRDFIEGLRIVRTGIDPQF